MRVSSGGGVPGGDGRVCREMREVLLERQLAVDLRVDGGVEKLVEAARWETDRGIYDGLIKQAIGIVFREAPVLPQWQPTFEIGIDPSLANFTHYIHGQVDFRPLRWT
jgi:hypothetical protein